METLGLKQEAERVLSEAAGKKKTFQGTAPVWDTTLVGLSLALDRWGQLVGTVHGCRGWVVCSAWNQGAGRSPTQCRVEDNDTTNTGLSRSDQSAVQSTGHRHACRLAGEHVGQRAPSLPCDRPV